MLRLVVGDVHTVVEEIGDSGRLFDLIEKTAIEDKVDEILFTGDLHHHFSITNIKVIAFYQQRFERLRRICRVRALKGNHDMAGDGSDYHALISYPSIDVVDKPTRIGNELFLPFIADPNLFLQVCKEGCDSGATIVFCHQEFNGAKYDNGSFIPHGVDPDRVPCSIVSGHIHTPQRFGNVWYVGAPRWRILSDANVERHIHVVRFDPDGTYEVVKSVPTKDVCKAIYAIDLIEGEEEKEVPENTKDDIRVHIEGSQEYVRAKTAELSGKNVRVSSVIRSQRVKVKESDGIPQALKKFVAEYKPKFATPTAVLERLAWERIWPNQA